MSEADKDEAREAGPEVAAEGEETTTAEASGPDASGSDTRSADGAADAAEGAGAVAVAGDEPTSAGQEGDAPVSDLDVPDPEALADSPDDLVEGDMPTATANAPSGPVITGVKPIRIDSRGGTAVTMTGAGFVPGCRVFVGEEELIAEVVDSFTMRFVAPAGRGSASVVVESPGEKRSHESVTLFFVEGPTILRAIPSEGPTEGGIEVVLEGSGFNDGCTLSLFGTRSPELVFESTTRLRFVLPPAGDGPLEGALTITTLEGLMGAAEGVFHYRPLHPRIDSVEPDNGWVSGGKVITLRGEDFHARAQVLVGGAPGVVNFHSAAHVDVEIPPHAAPERVDIELVNPDKRSAVLAGSFRYEPVPAPPKILDLIPKAGLTTGGATIRLSGDNFTEDCRVRIGDVTAVRRFVSSKLIDFDLPPRTLPGPVAVEVQLGEVVVRVEEAFLYESPAASKIMSLEPRSGSTAGGTKVVIEGDSFPKNVSVRFGGEPCKSVFVKGPTRLEVVTPPLRTPGLVDVEVSSPETGRTISAKAFKYEATPAPIITLVSPNKGTIDGGTELSIEGKNFLDGVVVLVGNVPAKRVKRISGSVIEAFTPEGEDGKLVDVEVRNPDAQKAISRRAFQYDARYRQ